MKNITFASIAAIVLLICNAAALWALHSQKQEKEAILRTFYPLADKAVSLEEMAKDNARYDNRRLDDFAIADISKNERKMSDLFSGEDSLLFAVRVTDKFCSSCVEYCIKMVDSLKSISSSSIVYLMEARNFNVFEKTAKGCGILGRKIYKTDYLENPIDVAGQPYIMVLSKDLTIRYCYFPKKGHAKTDVEIIDMIIGFFKNNLQRN